MRVLIKARYKVVMNGLVEGHDYIDRVAVFEVPSNLWEPKMPKESAIVTLNNERGSSLREWMDASDVYLIFKFEIVQVTVEEEVVYKQPNDFDRLRVLLEKSESSQEFADSVIAVWIAMNAALKGLDFDKKVEIVFATLSTSVQAALVAYENVSNILKGKDKEGTTFLLQEGAHKTI